MGRRKKATPPYPLLHPQQQTLALCARRVRRRITGAQKECRRRIRCLRVPYAFRDENGRIDTPAARENWAEYLIDTALVSLAGDCPPDWEDLLDPDDVGELPMIGPYISRGSTESSRPNIARWHVRVSEF